METDHNVKRVVFIACTVICVLFALSSLAIYINKKENSGGKEQLEQEMQMEQTATANSADNIEETVVDGTQIFQGEADKDEKEKVYQYVTEHQDLLNESGVALEDALKGDVQIVGDESYVVEVGENDIFVNLHDDIMSVDPRTNIRGESEDAETVSALCTAVTASNDTLEEVGISADDLVVALSDGTASYEQKSDYLYEVEYESHKISINTLQDRVSVD